MRIAGYYEFVTFLSAVFCGIAEFNFLVALHENWGSFVVWGGLLAQLPASNTAASFSLTCSKLEGWCEVFIQVACKQTGNSGREALVILKESKTSRCVHSSTAPARCMRKHTSMVSACIYWFAVACTWLSTGKTLETGHHKCNMP